MRRICVCAVFLFLLAGCGREKTVDNQKKQEAVVQPNVNVAPPVAKNDGQANPPTPVAAFDSDKQQKYESALASALMALAERKWNVALTGFKKARDIQDNDFVREEIDKLKIRIEQDESARNAVKNIEIVLKDGQSDQAAQLAKQALVLYGDSDVALRLVQLCIQAEALQGVKKKEDPGVRFNRYRKEGEKALAEKNLRAAVFAFEIALQSQPDSDLQKTYEDARAKLDRYDALRQKAADLRRDPAQIEQAIDALKEAALAWNTQQIREELDDALLALQNRRDNVTVADFEIRNDIGMPDAGGAVADELLPLLRAKYDVVSRDQLRQALTDLKLDNGIPEDLQQQQQVGKLANVRYVVVGRIHRLAAVSVHARLIDVNTGLVVQTGKVLAPTVQEAVALMPELAKQLLMTDAEKMKADQEAQNLANLPIAIAANAAVPPAPPAPAKNDPPLPPLVMVNVAPPGVALVKQNMFARFGPPPDGVLALSPLDSGLSNRMVVAAVEMGDYLFRSGQFASAIRKYQFAASLAPDDPEILIRLERSRVYITPGTLPLSPFMKPRIAVLTFAAYGDPYVVPPSLSFWTPTNLAPYFSSRYDVVDPGEITWFMAKTGLTMNDLMADSNILRYLGRAVDVRYFVFGNHMQTTSFDVNAYLVDAELGGAIGTGRINVQTPFELKLRLRELAFLTMMSPGDRTIYVSQDVQFNTLLRQGLTLMNSAAYADAVPIFQSAVSLRPDSVQARIYLMQALNGAQMYAIRIQRRRQYDADRALFAQTQQQQVQFVVASDQARVAALAYAAGRSDADRQADLQFRIQAQAALVAQGQLALNGRQFGISLNFFQGAQDLVPGTTKIVPVADIERARRGAEANRELRIAQFAAAQQTALRQQRDQQLEKARVQIAVDQQRLKDLQAAHRAEQQKNDERAYAQNVESGQKFMSQKKYGAALSSFQAAQQIKQTPVVTQLIALATQRQTEATSKVAEEKKKVESVTPNTKTDGFKELVAKGNAALKANQYPDAVTAFQQALKLMPGDASTMQLLQQAQNAVNNRATAQADYQKAMAGGQKALAAKQYPSAIASFNEALKLMPGDAQAQQALKLAQRSYDEVQQQAAADSQKQAQFQGFLKAGNSAMTAKKYPDAVKSFQSALKVIPNEAQAQRGLQDAQKAIDAAKTAADASKTFFDAMKKGAAFEKELKYSDAIAAYQDALKARPKDVEAQAGLKKNQFNLNMQQGQQYLARSMFVDAQREFESALRLFPNDANAQKLLQKAKTKTK